MSAATFFFEKFNAFIASFTCIFRIIFKIKFTLIGEHCTFLTIARASTADLDPFWIAASIEFFFNIIPGFNEITFYEIQNRYELWDFWIIFTAGFTPIPYKTITISAGAFDINFIMFFIASIVGRGGRFFLLGFLIWKFGDPIKIFIDKYFNLLATIFTSLLIGGFIMINFFID